MNKFKPRLKYGNKIIEIDGIKFQSIKEGTRYSELKFLQNCGLISDLKLQVKFSLDLYNLCSDDLSEEIHITNYICDFVYYSLSNKECRYEFPKLIHEDCKGFRTELYKIKKNLMKAIYNIDILET